MRFSDEEWNSKKLGKICKITMGQSPSSQNYSENESDTILIQGNADIINGKVVPRIYTSQITKISNPGDIILTVRAPVGDLAINEFESCIGRGVCSIEGNKFIYYFLQSFKDKHGWERLSQGSTFESINSNDIKNVTIKTPSKTTQEKISTFFSAIDEKIELLEQKHQYYLDFKKYLMQQIFAQKLRFDFEGEWEEKFVDEIFDITRGEVIAKKLIKENPDEKYPFPVYSSQTTNKGIMGYYKDYDFDGKYITWTTDGANAGKTVYRNGKFKCSNVCGVLKPKKEYGGFANQFIAEYLDSITYKYVSYVGNPKLMNNSMAKIKIKYPPLYEQEKISKLFGQVDCAVDLIQLQLSEMVEFKKGLLQQMLILSILLAHISTTKC